MLADGDMFPWRQHPFFLGWLLGCQGNRRPIQSQCSSQTPKSTENVVGENAFYLNVVGENAFYLNVVGENAFYLNVNVHL